MNFSLDSFPIISPIAGVVFILAFWVLTAIIHISFACAVLADAQLLWKHRSQHPFLVGGGLWALATLLGGVLIAALYWLIHHSTLRPQPSPAVPPRPEPTGS